jgi:hypothetical protein
MKRTAEKQFSIACVLNRYASKLFVHYAYVITNMTVIAYVRSHLDIATDAIYERHSA